MLHVHSHVVFLWAASAVLATVVQASEPAVPAPVENAVIVFSVEEESAFVEIILGPIVRRAQPVAMATTHKMADVRSYIGRVVRRQYRVGGAASTAEVHSHYLQWLESAGFDVLLDARGDSAMAAGGTSWALRAYGELPTEIATELSGTLDKSRRRYLVAEKRDVLEREHTVIALLINPRRTGDLRVQLDAVFVDIAETSRLSMTAGQLHERLISQGRVELPGIRYQGRRVSPRDSATLVLVQVAVLLRDHSDVALTVVCRATVEGNTDASQQLALTRAEALVDLLVAEYGAPAGRLEARAADGRATHLDELERDESTAHGKETAAPTDAVELELRR